MFLKKKHTHTLITSSFSHRFILRSAVVTDFTPDRVTTDNRVCTCLTLKRRSVLWLACTVSLICSFRNAHYTPTGMDLNTAAVSWPWVSRDERSWWAVNRASVWRPGRSAGVRVPFLHQPRCPLPAAAPQHWLIECDAILQNRMSSIVLLNKGSLSPIDGQLIFFFLVLWMRRGGGELEGFFFFAFKGTFSVVEYTHPHLLWAESRGLFFQSATFGLC